MKLKDIKVGTRLFTGFGIMNLFLVLICIFGLSMITGVNNRLEQIVGKSNASVSATSGAKDGGSATASTVSQENGQKQIADLAAEAKVFYRMCFTYVIMGVFLSIAIGIVIAVVLTRSIVQPVTQTISDAKFLSEGNLRRKILVDRKDEFGIQAGVVKGMVEKWRGIIGSIKQASDSVAAAGSQLAGSAVHMSEGASEQAERAHQVAAASEEMSQTVLDIAQNA